LAAIRRWRPRWYRTVLLSLLTGVGTGLGVAAFDGLTADLSLARVERMPTALLVAAPAVGLILASLALRWAAGESGPATAATADEYIKNFHDRGTRLDLAPFGAKLLAAFATLGFGGPLGFEGPSIYLGAGVGSFLQRRFTRFFTRDEAKVLLVAGAAAGVAAIFKAPATGAIFALEVPYQRDVAGRSALPALLAAASSYLTFVAFQGTKPILAIVGNPAFDARDLAGALLIGLCSGVGCRAFAWMLKRAKGVARQPLALRLPLAALVLGSLVAVSIHLFDGRPLALGPGYSAIAWATDPRHGLGLIVALFVIRGLGSTAVIAGGGVGGIFIPLVVQGALLGRLVSGALPVSNASLFPLVGMAAFLGAGYRTPLAAVMFVAESTGRPGFVVPGLLATALAQLVMGTASVTEYQHGSRAGHVERRFRLPVTNALLADVYTCDPTATVHELLDVHFLAARARSIPVVDSAAYRGMARLDDAASVPEVERDSTLVSAVLRDDVPVARVTWNLRQAVAAMEDSDVDRLAVVDEDGTFLGVVTLTDILRLDQILAETDDPAQA
jgi:CIC family chloride channel protein